VTEFHKIIGIGYCIIKEVRLNFMNNLSGKAYAFLFKPRGSGRGYTHFPMLEGVALPLFSKD
jgi:hypothetical protein